MTLDKDDYTNLLRLLEEVPVKGTQSIKYVAILLHKIEQRVMTWYDGHPSGLRVVDMPEKASLPDMPAAASLPPALLAALPALLSQTEIPLNKE